MGSVAPRQSGGTAIYKVRGQAIRTASEKAVIKLFAYQSVSNVLLTCCQDHYFGMSEHFKGKPLPRALSVTPSPSWPTPVFPVISYLL